MTHYLRLLDGREVRVETKPRRRYWPRRRQDELITDAPWNVQILHPATMPRDERLPKPVVFRERESK